MRSIAKRTAPFAMAVAFIALLSTQALLAQKREAVLEFVPAGASVRFALDASFHVVHGTFDIEHGAIRFDPASRAVSGEIVVNAASGRSGNDGRDRRMHREILESARYPEIAFRPDRVEGTVEAPGASTIQVHGGPAMVCLSVLPSRHSMAMNALPLLSPMSYTVQMFG